MIQNLTKQVLILFEQFAENFHDAEFAYINFNLKSTILLSITNQTQIPQVTQFSPEIWQNR